MRGCCSVSGKSGECLALDSPPHIPRVSVCAQAEAWSLRSELAALQEGQALQQRDSAERYEARLREAEEARAELTSALLVRGAWG